MVSYEVTSVPEPRLAAAFEAYMRDKHIRDVLETGCFVSAQFAKTPSGQFRTSYVAATQEDLDVYLRDHASRLRGDFAAHFPEGIEVTRATWTVVEEWSS